MKTFIHLLILGACLQAAGARADTPPLLTMEQVDLSELPGQDLYYIHGTFKTAADPAQVWKVLSDYEGLQGVVTSLRSSKIVGRDADGLLVEQVLDGQFLFFHKGVRLLLRVKEQPPTRIDFRQSGNGPFRHYEGSWAIESEGGVCRVDYTLAVSRGDMAPRFLERKLFRDNSRGLLKELNAEVSRRAAQAPVATANKPSAGGL
jgi:carbon monoxide dehydrogenase subunit G